MSAASNPIQAWLRAWWFLIVVGVTAFGSIITLYFDVQYVTAAVNPKSLTQYGIDRAKLNQKREIRWCLQKLLWDEKFSRLTVLGCAD